MRRSPSNSRGSTSRSKILLAGLVAVALTTSACGDWIEEVTATGTDSTRDSPAPDSVPVTEPPTAQATQPPTTSIETTQPSTTQPPTTEPSTTQPPTTEPPTFLEQLNGSWTLIEWRERSGTMTLGMSDEGGTLEIDSIGHAVWRVVIDDGGPDPGFERAATCLGIFRSGNGVLEGVLGRLVVNGEDLLGDRLNWQGNLTSLRADAELAFCGIASTFDPLFVYDTHESPYALTLSTAADGRDTPILEMANAAGTFTWIKNG